MTTNYYCPTCQTVFSEAKLPNMNKSHHCGDLARVTDFFDDEQKTSEEAPSH